MSGNALNLRYVDWIWNVSGDVPLPPGQSHDAAFDRLEPLFRTTGTSHERSDDTLTFRKKDPAAQDKMSVFETGTLQVEDSPEGRVLRYRLASRALLLCFLAPLFFLGIAQLTIAVDKLQTPTAAEAAKAEAEAEKAAAKKASLPQNPIDKALGAPAPEKPKAKKDKEKDKKRSPTPAYVFAGIFAALYIIGRILEAWLVNRLFRKQLEGA